ncbi:MAG: aminotransferase class IV [Bacteroidia bacterium]
MHIIHNGKLTDEDKCLTAINRAYQYGDAIFETIKYRNGHALFINDHYERLIKSMNMLKLIVPDFFSIDFFQERFLQLTLKNNCTASARIRLQVYRDSDGYYFPSDNQCGFTITSAHLKTPDYVLNESPIKIDAYTENYKSKTPLSNLKSANALLYIVAAQYANQHGLDDCFILNEDGNVAEAVSSNVFIFKDDLFFTPPLNDGCVEGIMRKQFIQIATRENISCVEKSLNIKEINAADEIILTNVIQGIRVVKCDSQMKKTMQRFINMLNAN